MGLFSSNVTGHSKSLLVNYWRFCVGHCTDHCETPGQGCRSTTGKIFFMSLTRVPKIILESKIFKCACTGKSLSEALIFASTNPQFDNIWFIGLQVQYMKIPSSNLGRTCCVQKLFLTFRTTCSPHVLQKEEILTKIHL